MNRTTRTATIANFVNRYICEEADCVGQLAIDCSLDSLRADIGKLVTMGRTDAWYLSYSRVLTSLTHAEECWTQNNELPTSVMHSHLTHETGREYANLIKWVVLQVSVHLCNV